MLDKALSLFSIAVRLDNVKAKFDPNQQCGLSVMSIFNKNTLVVL